MNIKVCDVCYQEKDENSDFLRLISKATYRISYKKRSTRQRIILDVCAKHQDFFKNEPNYEAAESKYKKLIATKNQYDICEVERRDIQWTV